MSSYKSLINNYPKEDQDQDQNQDPFADDHTLVDNNRPLLSNSDHKSSSSNNSENNHNEFIQNDDNNEIIDNSDDDDQFDPIVFKHEDIENSSLASNSFTDNFGNSYTNIDFDNKKYTSNLKFKGNKLVYFTSAFVSLFVSLFGYEQGVCSGILAYDTFNLYFNNPNAAIIGTIISILEIGAMISSLLVAKISDQIGRKRTILLGTFIFMIGGCLQSFCPNLFIFGIGRVFSGIGVGVLSTIVVSYQAEISPGEERGKLLCGEFTGNIFGYALSVWVDYFCYFIQDIQNARNHPNSFYANLSWRLPLFIQVIIAFILFLGGFFIVESPRWLLDNDMDQQGFHVLSLLYDSHKNSSQPRIEFFMIKNSILREKRDVPKSERTWKYLFTKYKIRCFVACSALIFAQFNGINIISYYAPLVFEQAGFNDSGALLMTGINGTIYLLSTIPPWFLVDKWGRRPILISSGLAMGICLFMVACFMKLNKSFTPTIVAILVIIFNASFGFGFGPIPFLLAGESFPLSVRSKGVSLAVSCNWLSNFIVGLLAPILRQLIQWAMYLFPATSCIISVVVVIIFYPETKGVELEDIDQIFDDFYSINPLNRITESLRRKNRIKRKYDKINHQINANDNYEMQQLNEFDYEDENENENDNDNDNDVERREML
ncbi:unnamed protein product [Candida verbasci]|uniref:Major facilitator superfamily (MFS) profile domain-containing protein n=1 Tax=Candida verbasci TaxID=1227364 RepID=A0A9W4TUY4_9ASCO|nr:unnamed protein product [Candida verbasci]